jgi:hypothetical protein
VVAEKRSSYKYFKCNENNDDLRVIFCWSQWSQSTNKFTDYVYVSGVDGGLSQELRPKKSLAVPNLLNLQVRKLYESSFRM